MNALLSYSEAMAVIDHLLPFDDGDLVTHAPLSACLGATLGTELIAPIPSPPFTNAAMDGIAVKYDDLAGGALQPITTIYAEASSARGEVPYRRQSCARIMTGAPLPTWADTVVPVEKTRVEADSRIMVTEPIVMGAHIRHVGEDLPVGAPLLKKGAMLRPEDLMIAAAFGFATLPIKSSLAVHFLSTGSELCEPGERLAPGMVYNASKYFLLAAAQELGLRQLTHETLPDDADMARQFVERVVHAGNPTLIISTGAVSAGEADFIPRLAAQMDFAPLFHKVAIRPGKPVFLAKRGPALWLGLPGNPISTAVGWHFFARPLLARLGAAKPLEKRSFILRNEVVKPESLRCFYRAEVSADQRNVWVSRTQGSAHFASSLNMGAYVELPEGQARFPANSPVTGIFVR